jgi:branched-chain amino acid aminotransferase
MQAKATMNYNHLQLCQHELDERGLDDVLLSDNQGYITEGLVTNIFVVKGGYVLTPPSDGSILPGITRKSVYNIFQSVEFKKLLLQDKLASQMPNMILEKRLTKADILTADEMFACGTFSEIVPIIEVEGRKIGDGSPGRFTTHLRQAYKDSVRSKVRYGVILDRA